MNSMGPCKVPSCEFNPFASGIALQTVHSDAVTGKFNNVLHCPDRHHVPPKTKQKRQQNYWGFIIFIVVGLFFLSLCAIERKVCTLTSKLAH